MNLGQFRHLTKDLSDNTMLVEETYMNCFTEIDACVLNTIIHLSIDGKGRHAYQDFGCNMPKDEEFPTIIVGTKYPY